MRNSNSKKLKIIYTVIFVALFLFLNEILLWGLKDDVFMRINVKRGCENQYEDIILGTSQSRAGINPSKVEEVTGRKTANLSIPLSSPLDNYYFLKQICASGHKPKRVVYELDPYYLSDAKAGGHYYIYPNGPVKLEYFLAAMKNDWRITLSPWVFQLGNYYHMLEVAKGKWDFLHDQYDHNYNGFVYYGDDVPFTDKVTTDREFNVTSSADQYLRKMYAFCQAQEIDFVLIQMPVSDDIYKNAEKTYRSGADSYMKEVAEELDIPYWNFNLLLSTELNLRLEGNFIDTEGHMYGQMADRFSEILGLYMLKEQ